MASIPGMARALSNLGVYGDPLKSNINVNGDLITCTLQWDINKCQSNFIVISDDSDVDDLDLCKGGRTLVPVSNAKTSQPDKNVSSVVKRERSDSYTNGANSCSKPRALVHTHTRRIKQEILDGSVKIKQESKDRFFDKTNHKSSALVLPCKLEMPDAYDGMDDFRTFRNCANEHNDLVKGTQTDSVLLQNVSTQTYGIGNRGKIFSLVSCSKRRRQESTSDTAREFDRASKQPRHSWDLPCTRRDMTCFAPVAEHGKRVILGGMLKDNGRTATMVIWRKGRPEGAKFYNSVLDKDKFDDTWSEYVAHGQVRPKPKMLEVDVKKVLEDLVRYFRKNVETIRKKAEKTDNDGK